ncbi:hypothetical protein M9H77_27573 [Catharanthus roseus]|uniref:Uncharacterized protein n=1 Tax=Catharanthus roseus TaxID=4058 RepID=A0ACC0AD43_CATRO|nr:hypothetical protein M9H77_27573 [Catharanthus roseus]
MDSHPITLHILIKSADIFKIFNFFPRIHLYATAELSIISNSTASSKQTIKTSTDKLSGAHPFWCFPVNFQFEKSKLIQNQLRLVFRVKRRQTLGGDRDIGIASINVLQLFDFAKNHEYHNPVALTLINSGSRSGKPRGVIYLLYLFEHQQQNQIKPAGGAGELVLPPPRSIPSAPYIGGGVYGSVPSAPPCPVPSAPFFPEDDYFPATAPLLESHEEDSAFLPSELYIPIRKEKLL